MIIRTVPISAAESFHRTREDEGCAEERKPNGNESRVIWRGHIPTCQTEADECEYEQYEL